MSIAGPGGPGQGAAWPGAAAPGSPGQGRRTRVPGRVARTSEERLAFAPVRERRRGDRVALDQVQLVESLAQLAGLRVPEPDQVADPQPVCGGAENGCLHLARSLVAVQPQSGRQVRAGEPGAVTGPRGQVATTEQSSHAGARPA